MIRTRESIFLFSGRRLGRQQEISLVLAKTPPIHGPFYTEIGKFRNIQCVNHGGEVIIFTCL